MDVKRIKYLFFDYDNTVRVDGEITPKTREAMNKAQKKGYRLILCTGRARGAKSAEMDVIPWDGMIFGGCDIYFDGSWCEEKILTENEVRAWVEYSMRTHRHLAYEGQNKILMFHFEDREEDYTDVEIAKQVSEIIEQMPQNPATKFSVIGTDFDPNTFPKTRMNPILHAEYVEVFGEGCDKGKAILRFCRLMNASIEECACFGDSLNDYPMFTVCPVSIAMPWSPDALKAAATYCAKEKEGVQEGIEWILSKV